MIMVCSSCSCASACGGNEARETTRSALTGAGEGGWFPPDGEGASPNASELASASLHTRRSVNLPEMAKPAIVGEAADKSTRQAARGDWRERAPKERIRYPGDPSRSAAPAVGAALDPWGSHNPRSPRRWESERFVVVWKRGNARGAKGPFRRRVFTRKGGSA